VLWAKINKGINISDSTMTKIRTGISRLLAANPADIAVLLIARRSWNGLTSSIMAFLLKAPGLHLGPGCRVLGGRHISFGKGVYAERNLWLEAVTSYRSQRFNPQITIGDHVCFSDGVHISSIANITIGCDCLFGSRIYIADHNHGIYRGEQQSSPEQPPAHRLLGGGGPVVIGEKVWIGDNVVIVGPATIGGGAIIGANSVVRGVVPANTIVAGAPAKLIKIFNSKTGSWDKA
jgi:acetyltransferase-like isoleucine patch superfamily enzyme